MPQMSSNVDTVIRYRNGPMFAPVCGIQMYTAMAMKGELPPYLLLLAHDVLARPEEYSFTFGMMHKIWEAKGITPTIIMDNSVVELKTPVVDPLQIAEAANIVKANVIVLPDVYKDGPATIKSTADHYDNWHNIMREKLNHDWTFMMVPQGKTIQDFVTCAEFMASDSIWENVHYWGIPRNLVELHGSREYGLLMCEMLNRNRAIHMLGFSDNFVDDIWLTYRYAHFVLGIDSAVPLRVPEKFHLTMEVPPRPEGWLETAEYTPLVGQNIKYVQDLISGKHFG